MARPALNFQPLGPDDVGLLFEWRNSSDARQFSINSKSLVWETHVEWCNIRRQKPRTSVWIAYVNNQPVGYGRLERVGKISVYVTKDQNRRGYGLRIIQQMCIFATDQNSQPTADIHELNIASLRAFEKAGFVHVGQRGPFLVYRLAQRETVAAAKTKAKSPPSKSVLARLTGQ